MPEPISQDNNIANQFFGAAEQGLQGERNRLTDLNEKRDTLAANTDRSAWNGDPSSSETEKFVNDSFIENQKGKIRRIEEAVNVLSQKQSIIAEKGEVSQRKYGDIIWGYKTSFPDVDGTIIEEELNVMLVPSALVGDGEFKTEIGGKEVEFAVISPECDMGKKIVEASL